MCCGYYLKIGSVDSVFVLSVNFYIFISYDTHNSSVRRNFVLKKRPAFLFISVLCLAALLIIAGIMPASVAWAAAPPETDSPSVVLTEAGTGRVLYEKNAREHRPIASMVKIMTLLLTFENIDGGGLSLTDEVTVSENAASMGGSQAFLDAHATYTVGELVKSAVVASANDSCVALAETISGSVEGFVSEMNERAESLGMDDTVFVNCTGLPAPGQYSCARDAAIMFGELIKHEDFFGYSGVWMFDFHHPSGRDTVLTNTNKLIRSYEGCDGGKTGFTNEAMYCLSATAKKDGMRLIGVITGAPSAKKRNAEMCSLFDYGFANWTMRQAIFAGVELDCRLEAPYSKEGAVSVAPVSDGFYLSERGSDESAEITYELIGQPELPLPAGSVVGRMTARVNGEVVAESDLATTGDLTERSYLDVLRELLRGGI